MKPTKELLFVGFWLLSSRCKKNKHPTASYPLAECESGAQTHVAHSEMWQPVLGKPAKLMSIIGNLCSLSTTHVPDSSCRQYRDNIRSDREWGLNHYLTLLHWNSDWISPSHNMLSRFQKTAEFQDLQSVSKELNLSWASQMLPYKDMSWLETWGQFCFEDLHIQKALEKKWALSDVVCCKVPFYWCQIWTSTLCRIVYTVRVFLLSDMQYRQV